MGGGEWVRLDCESGGMREAQSEIGTEEAAVSQPPGLPDQIWRVERAAFMPQ